MKKRKKRPAGLETLSVVALAASLVVPTFADDYWDTSRHVPSAPTSSASGTMEGLNAKTRGVNGTDVGRDVDIWYWTRFVSNACWISRDKAGMMIIVR